MDPAGTNPWCSQCQAEYQAIRQKMLLDRAFARGYAAGAAAMRAAGQYHFRTFPTAHFSGQEAAVLLGRVEAPRHGKDPEAAPPEPPA